MSKDSIEHILSSSNLILFFSLPFRPAGKRNLFYNGHIALGLEGLVYQVYNPRLLRSDFLFSVMPVRDWLFGKGGKWVERDPDSPCFRHVYLYGKSESRRTVVYGAGCKVDTRIIASLREQFMKEDDRYKIGRGSYDLLRNNCSSLIAGSMSKVGLIFPAPFNIIPVLFFKRFILNNLRTKKISVGKISAFDGAAFTLHRYCFGMRGMYPEHIMDRWVMRIAGIY